MLEKIRDGSQGLVAKVILGIVVLTFALAGVSSYLGSSSAPPVASVNGEEISKADFEKRYQNNRSRMEQQFGKMFEQLAADEGYMRNFREGVLEQLISESLEDQLAEKLGLRVGNEKAKEIIRNISIFQVNGQYDNDTWKEFLRRNQYQPNTFIDLVRTDETRKQLRQAVMGTDFDLPSEVQAYSKLDKQTRDIEYVVFKQDDYKDKVVLSDEDKNAYYQAHLENYRTQEKVSVRYVDLKVSDIAKTIAVSDEALEKYYQDNIGSYRTQVAKRRASHIFVEFGDDEAKAKAKAEGLLARVKGGEDFAAVAKEASEDTISAEKGGDLDWFERGVMGDDFDKAVFGLKHINDISGVVRSESGFHIIKLTGDKPEATQPFSEVKEEVAKAYKHNQALEIFTDKQTKLAEMAFEVPDSLEDAASAIDAKVQETALFGRIGAPAAVNFPKVLQQAFSEPVLMDRVNSELIEVSDEHVMVIRVKDHEPSRIQSLKEVTAKVEAELTKEKAQALAKEAAEALMAKVDNSKSLAEDDSAKAMTVVAKQGVERFSSDVDSSLRTEVFKMAHPADGKHTLDALKMSNGDYALVSLDKVTEGSVPEDTKAIAQRMSAQKAQASMESFIESLKEKAEIVNNSSALGLGTNKS